MGLSLRSLEKPIRSNLQTAVNRSWTIIQPHHDLPFLISSRIHPFHHLPWTLYPLVEAFDIHHQNPTLRKSFAVRLALKSSRHLNPPPKRKAQ